MKLTVLGSGTAIPSAERAGPSVMVEEGDSLILVDAGPGSLANLRKTGRSHREVTHVCFTHHHLDHTAEFVPLIFALRNEDRPLKGEGLTLIGSTEFFDWADRLSVPYGQWLDDTPFKIHSHRIDTRPYHGENWDLDARPVKHIDSSVAYAFVDADGHKIVVSGDTEYCEGIIEISKGADLLILECAFPEGESRAGHLVPSEAGKIAEAADVKKLVLTHFYPLCRGEDLLTPLKESDRGDVILADDLLTLVP